MNCPTRSVMVVDGPVGHAVGHADDPLARKRRAVWRNGRRNDLLAEIGRGFAERRIELLQDAGLFLDAREWPLPAGAMTTLLVESLEHAQELARRLPDWALRHAAPAPAVHGLRCLPPGAPTIITMSAAAANPLLLSPTVLIVGTGGRHCVFQQDELLGELWAIAQVVVDVADDFDELAVRETTMRLLGYIGDGWALHTSRRWPFPEGDLPGQPVTVSARREKRGVWEYYERRIDARERRVERVQRTEQDQ